MMEIKLEQKVVDKETNSEIELIKCACDNEVFYVSTAGLLICACCHMNPTDASQAILDEELNQLESASKEV